MPNRTHVEMLKKSADEFQMWRESTGMEKLDYSELDFGKVMAAPGVTRRQLDGHNLSGANLTGAILSCPFQGVTLDGADLGGATCCNTQFDQCSFNGTDVSRADFYEAHFQSVDFTGIKGTETAKNLHTATETHARVYLPHFEDCDRTWSQRYVSWEVIRKVGNLKLFGVSYALLAFLLIVVQLVGLYNEKIDIAKAWATRAADSDNDATRILAEEITNHANVFRFSRNTVVLFVSTLLLVIASTIYALACPDEIKHFNRTQWVHELKNPLLTYWAMAWKRKSLRLVCAFFYSFGGAGVLSLLLWKVGVALVLVVKYANVLPE